MDRTQSVLRPGLSLSNTIVPEPEVLKVEHSLWYQGVIDGVDVTNYYIYGIYSVPILCCFVDWIVTSV